MKTSVKRDKIEDHKDNSKHLKFYRTRDYQENCIIEQEQNVYLIKDFR